MKRTVNEAADLISALVTCVSCQLKFNAKYRIQYNDDDFCSKDCLPQKETDRSYLLGFVSDFSVAKPTNASKQTEGRTCRNVAPRNNSITLPFEDTPECKPRSPSATGYCPMPGCDGTGHVTGKYSTHRSMYGCPKYNAAKPPLVNEPPKCPWPGCDGNGHVKPDLFSTHRSLSGCPRRTNSNVEPAALEKCSSSDVEASPRGNKRAYSVADIPKYSSSSESVLSSASNTNDGYPTQQNGTQQELTTIDDFTPPFTTPPSDSQYNNSLDSNGNEFSAEENPSEINKRRKLSRCEFPGCSGAGHVTKKFSKHRSLYGCPLAAKLAKQCEDANNASCPYPGCSGKGNLLDEAETHTSLACCPKASKIADSDVRCPTLNCDGRGHVTGRFSSHRSVSGCPRAALEAEQSAAESAVTDNPANQRIALNSVDDDEARPSKVTPEERQAHLHSMVRVVSVLKANNSAMEKQLDTLTQEVDVLKSHAAGEFRQLGLIKGDEDDLVKKATSLRRVLLQAFSRTEFASGADGILNASHGNVDASLDHVLGGILSGEQCPRVLFGLLQVSMQEVRC